MTALHRATGIALVLTYALIVLGAWVRASGSGLSCPDWPTCYGHWVPLPGEIPPDAGYAYHQVMLEWGHRLLAGVILGPLILLIGWLAWRARSHNARLPAYAAALIALLLIQAGLGGVTVLDQNSPWSVALHSSTALLLFSALWLIFARTGPTAAGARAALPLGVVVWLLALGAMASAAITTKSGASLACSTWPLCDGALIPDLADPEIRINFSHRLLAAGVGVGTLALLAASRGQPGPVRALAGWALLLAAAEILLGALVVIWQVPIATAVLHQAVGVLLFGLLSLLMWRCLGTAPAHPEKLAHAGLSGA
ncbi:MAG: COX15/CtaA family protein [Geminicoccaceae bacterium]